MGFKNDLNIMKAFIPIIKQLSVKLLSGDVKNIMEVDKPAIISTEYSFQEVIAFDNFNTSFLEKAAKVKDDVILRMKYFIAFLISSKHIASTKIFTRVPIDPLIGETLQVHYIFFIKKS